MRAAGTAATKSWSTGRGPGVEVASQLGGKGRPGLGMGRRLKLRDATGLTLFGSM